MELLKKLYQIAAPSGKEKKMIQFIKNRLKEMSGVIYHVDKIGNIYAVKGKNTTYPCLVSHTDEVHLRPKEGYNVVVLQDEIIFGYDSIRKDFCGIGADDKNGIWVCLKCLEKYDSLKCAFFVDEERGCVGSRQADMDFFKDCRFVLQCDRRGNSDIVTDIGGTPLCSDEFIQAVDYKKQGYRRTAGMLTDVATLKEKKLSVSCVNISCGYYNPHTNREITDIRDLYKCLGFVCHIIENCTKVYSHTYTYRHPTFRSTSDWNLLSRFNTCNLLSEETEEVIILPHNRQYKQMLLKMTDMLAVTPSLRITDILRRLYIDFPSLQYSDYAMAYNEITGLIPADY